MAPQDTAFAIAPPSYESVILPGMYHGNVVKIQIENSNQPVVLNAINLDIEPTAPKVDVLGSNKIVPEDSAPVITEQPIEEQVNSNDNSTSESFSLRRKMKNCALKLRQKSSGVP